MSELLRPRGAPLTENPAAALNNDARWRLTQLEQRLIPSDDDPRGCVTACNVGSSYGTVSTSPWIPYLAAVTFDMIIVASNPPGNISVRKNGTQIAVALPGYNAVSLPFLPLDKLTFVMRIGSVTKLVVQAFFAGGAPSGSLIFDPGVSYRT